jgi:predicted phosphoribosyltransferase
VGLIAPPTAGIWHGGWVFEDREDAGRRLARSLRDLALVDPVVVGIPRGGVPVAAAVAAALGVRLDVLVVRKLGVPAQPELAMGAIAEGGVLFLDEDLVESLGVRPAEVADVQEREAAVVRARVKRLRGGRGGWALRARTVVIVDDGVATGATAAAACQVARARGAARIVVATPVGAPEALQRLAIANDVVCLLQPETFRAVGEFYRRFNATSDDEVAELLAGRPGRGSA